MTDNAKMNVRKQSGNTREQLAKEAVAALNKGFISLAKEGVDLERCTPDQLAELAADALAEEGFSTKSFTNGQLAELASGVVNTIKQLERAGMSPEALGGVDEFAEQKWRLTATVAGQVVVLVGLLVACILLLHSFDAALARAEEVNSWCWWHLRFGVGGAVVASVILGLAAIITAAVGEKRNLPGDGSVGNELILKAVENRTKHFSLLSMVVTGVMCLYGAWHVMSTLGFALATFLAVPLVLLEIIVFEIAARETFLLFGIVLWYRHCPCFARVLALHARKKGAAGSDDDE